MGILSTSAEYAKIGFKFVLNIFLPFMVSVFFNWVFALFFLYKWFGTTSIWDSAPALILLAGFCLGFPFVYFWMAKSYAVKRGMLGLYEEGHDVVEKAVGIVVQGAILGAQNQGIQTLFRGAKLKNRANLVKKIDKKLPRSIRSILNGFLGMVPFFAILKELQEKVDFKNNTQAMLQPLVQEKVDDYVKETLIGDSWLWFWSLVGLNILAMFITWWFI